MPADMPVPASPDQLVQILTTNLSAKFPDIPRERVHATVQTTYQRLARGAKITDHLAVLVQHEAGEHLRAAA